MLSRLFRRKEKTQAALLKTRRGWGGSIGAIFGRGPLADDTLWEQVEEAFTQQH